MHIVSHCICTPHMLASQYFCCSENHWLVVCMSSMASAWLLVATSIQICLARFGVDMLPECREDNNCLQNNRNEWGFVNGHIFSVITVQTIGEKCNRYILNAHTARTINCLPV